MMRRRSNEAHDLHRVVAVVHPPQSTFELASCAEVFGLPRPRLTTRYEFQVCAESPGLVTTLAGYEIAVEAGLDALEQADTIVIPGWQTPEAVAPGRVVDALRSAHNRGARIVAICAGSFLLAEAGLLCGRRATTHWRLARALAERFPDIEVDPDVLYVDHGDVATSAGTAAGIDLCLHIVRTDFGAAYAGHIARHMVMPPSREGGQLQYATPPERTPQPTYLAAILDWAISHLGHVNVEEMVQRSHMSHRTFARHFLLQAGVSPGRWLTSQRIAAARHMLEQSDLSVDSIARQVGLSSATNLRRHFRNHLRTTPGAYRRSFYQSASVRDRQNAHPAAGSRG